MRHARVHVVSLAVAACASAPHGAVLDKYPSEIAGRTTVEYYEVQGRSIPDLYKEMREKGPKIDGTSFVGETRSPMSWTFKYEQHGASCTISDVKFSMNARILLPHWTPPADTVPGAVAEWNRFIAALETHESGHKDITAKAGKEIIQKVRGMSGLCSTVGLRASDLARSIADRSSEEQKLYDSETRHGVTQGTALRGPRTTLVAQAGPSGSQVSAETAVPDLVTVAIDSVWRVLPAAFAELHLGVGLSDARAFVLGDSLTVKQTFDGDPVSAIVSCDSARAGTNAVPVSLFLTASLRPATLFRPGGAAPSGNGTMILVALHAVARPDSGVASLCRSTHSLERALLAAIRKQLGTP